MEEVQNLLKVRNTVFRFISHTFTSPLEAYTHFETQVMPITPTCKPATTELLQTQEVRQIFIPVSVKRAEGPDGSPGRVLRDCVHQLW